MRVLLSSLADPSVLVRHPVDYWGRPTGLFVPLVSFLIELADVKNAMNLRPGDFAAFQKAVLGQVNKDFPEWTGYIEQIRAVK